MAGLAFRNQYGGGLVEDSCNLGVHLDHVVAFDCNPLIASVDLGVDPIGEVLSNNSVNNVAQIRSAEFGDFLGWRKSPFDLLVVLGEIEDVLNGQAFKLRNDDDLHIVARDDALHPHCKISEMPDGDGLVTWEVSTDLGELESVHL